MWADKLPLALFILLIIVLVMFGPKQLPELGKSLGKTMKAVREGAEGKGDEELPEAAKAEADKAEDKEKAAQE